VAAGVTSVPLNVSVSEGAAIKQLAIVGLVQTVIELVGKFARNVRKIIAKDAFGTKFIASNV